MRTRMMENSISIDKDIDPINNQALDLAIASTKNLTCQVSGTQQSSTLSCDTNKESLSETNLHGKYGIVTVDKNIIRLFCL